MSASKNSNEYDTHTSSNKNNEDAKAWGDSHKSGWGEGGPSHKQGKEGSNEKQDKDGRDHEEKDKNEHEQEEGKRSGKKDDDHREGGDKDDAKQKGDKKGRQEGSDGDDLLVGTDSNDHIDGEDGNDEIQGLAGNDRLDGGDGDDLLIGGDGNDQLDGDDGNDTLQGDAGNDNLDGGDGNDVLLGGAGNDKLEGKDGDDTLRGGPGRDNVRGGDGDDLFIWKAGDGEDKLDGGRGTDSIVITTSDIEQQLVTIDTNRKGNIVINLDGSEGAELELKDIELFNLVYGQGGVILNLGEGAGDVFGDEPLPIGGGEGGDVIDVAGSNVPVSVDAGTGDDQVTGGNANDQISGGEGNDVISGGGGDDVIDAGVGDDQVVWASGDGNDTIDGGEGFDALDLTLDETTSTSFSVAADANGNVILIGNDGTQLTVDGVEDIVFKAGAAGTTISIGDLTGTDIAQDTLYFVGGVGNDVFDASPTDRRIDVRGNGGNDQLFSGAANDFLDGGDGDDVLDAGSGSGSDVVRGGSGNDLIGLTIGDDLNGGTADDIDGGADNDQLDLTFVETTNFDLVLRVESNGDGSFRVIGDDLGSNQDETANVANVESLRIIASEGALNFELGSLSDTSLASNGVIFEGSADDDFFNGANTDVPLILNGGDGNNALIGGSAADQLHGGSGNDSLQGSDGDDLLTGSTGDDILNGGTGFDTLSYAGASGPITLDLSLVGAQDTGSSGVDTLLNIERIEGSAFDDSLIGNSLNNVLVGGDGADYLSGGDGFDILFGGAGDDTLVDPGFNDPLIGGAGNDYIDGVPSYASDPGAVIVNFSSASVVVGANTVAARSALDGYGDTDTFSVTASNLAGSAFDDHVTGSAESNGWFLRGGDDDAFGLDGDDFIMGGSGNDYIDGGDGFDTARYLEDGFDSAGAPIQGVNVNLALKTATDGFGDTDTLENIEAISGSNLDDGITGDDLANRLAGNGGIDTIDGAGGDDVLLGGAGDDTLTGGADADRFEFTVLGQSGVPQFGTDTITDFDVSQDVLDFTPFDSLNSLADVQAIASDNGADTTISIAGAGSIVLQGVLVADLLGSNFEFANPGPGGPIVGTEAGETLDGSPEADVIQGLGGDDVLRGLAGDDQLEGGSGNDELRGFAGNDLLIGGDGFDSADYREDIAGVTVNLSTQIAIDGWGNTDSLVEIENVVGSDFADLITGDFNSNFIWGGDGNDFIDGVSGNDQLWGDDGDDTLIAGPAAGGLIWLRGGAGNDILTGNAGGGGIEVLLGEEGDDTLTDPGGIFSVLNGGPGNDYIDGFASYLGGPARVIINLDNSVWNIAGETVQPRSAIDSWNDIDTFGPATIRTRSTDFDDYIRGSDFGQRIDALAGDDEIHALGGDDQLFAGPGSDIIYGGDGWDNLIYNVTASAMGEASHGVVVNLGNTDFSYGSEVPGIVAGTALANTALDQWDDPLGDRGIDSVFEIEAVVGSPFDDVIIGGTEHNFLEGMEGDDQIYGGDVEGDNLVGGPGNDYLDGQGGAWDTAWYFMWNGSGGGVTVNLSTGTTTEDGFGGQDTLVNIENVEGSGYDDHITGDANNNFLRGNDGNDIINAGAGDDGVNGDGGDDQIDGGAGNDFIDASPGADQTDGGADWDIYNFNPNVGTTQGAVVSLAGTADANGYFTIANNGFGGTGLIKNVEGLWGTDYNDSFTGDDNDNELQGFVGDDILIGNGGNDQLFGMDDNDTLNGGDGDDILDGGENNDNLTGGAGSDQFRFIRKTWDGNLVSFGEDVIEDFDINADILDLYNVPEFTSLDAILAATTDGGSDAVIAFDTVDQGITETNSITLKNINKADFQNMNIWIAPIQGTEGNDVLNGSEFGERIEGLGGDDVINGMGGNDNIEDGYGNDQVFGGAGDDWFNASPGDDLFDGGDDFDSVSYRWWFEPSAGVEINLALATNQVINDGYGGTDTLVSIENVLGSDVADILIGNDLENSLHGEGGNDNINGAGGNDFILGGPGDDILDGGDDFDTVAYPFWGEVNQAIDIDLENNIANNDGFGNVDTLLNFENVQGSQFNDVIRGDSQSNFIRGEDGNDTIIPRGGSDFIQGGFGADTFIYADSDGSLQFDSIGDFEPGLDQIDLQGIASLSDFAGVTAAATEVGSNLEIDLGNGNTLELISIGIADISAGDFLF